MVYFVDKEFSMIDKLTEATFIKRHEANPILSKENVTYEAALIFNAGIVKFKGRYIMVFRNDYGVRKDSVHPHSTNLGLAESQDGVSWTAVPEPLITLDQAKDLGAPFFANRGREEILRFYDPRLTVIEERCYLCFAIDTPHGVRGGIAVTDDLKTFEILSITAPENRNMVLFPEKIDGWYYRLERPFPIYSRPEPEAFDIWISRSRDLKYWGDTDLVMGVEDVPFADRKIGPGAPPVKTEQGWLTLFHAVDYDENRGKNGWEESWKKRYTIGLMLLDLKNPAKVLKIGKTPLMIPKEAYETDEGFRTHVLFPGGMILEESGEVKIYYGAADTVECLATAQLEDLLGFLDV
jgi:beta-1,4-mannooligosaccharide/beta-1,4-mannosyl-N-acetylglucosamine phosphorylase